MPKNWWDDNKGSPGSAQDAWQRLSQGQTIGKKVNIPIVRDALNTPIGASLNILQIGGGNSEALQLCITLAPPAIIPVIQFPGSIVPMDQGIVQAATGERTNESFLTSPYTGPSAINGDLSWTQALCTVEWGIGGVQSKVQCDFANGLVLNICASWVRVSLATDSIHEALILTGGVITLAAFIGPGYPKANNAQRTFNIGLLNGSGGGVPPGFPLLPYGVAIPGIKNMYPVPFMAKQATLMGGTFNHPLDANLVFSRDSYGELPLAITSFSPTNRYPAIVPNGAMYFTVQNNSISANDVQVVFDLAV